MTSFSLLTPAAKSSSAPFWLQVHQGRPGLLAERRGLYRLAWEWHATPDKVSLLLWLPTAHQGSLAGQVYHAWPGATLSPAPDPFDTWHPASVWAAAPSLHFAYSLATKGDASSILSALSAIDGRACLQVVVRPVGQGWVQAAQYARASVEAGKSPGSRRAGASLADGLAGVLDAAVSSVFGEAPKAAKEATKPPDLKKCSEAGFTVAVRLAASGKHSLRVLSSVAAGLRELRGEAEWLPVRPLLGMEAVYHQALKRRFPSTEGCVLGLSELATLASPAGPGHGKVAYAPSGATEPPEVLVTGVAERVMVGEADAPGWEDEGRAGLPLGTVEWRGESRLVRLPCDLVDTLVHPKLIVGSMESGKTTLATNLVVGAANLGYGSLYVDKADGAALGRIAAALPHSSAKDIVWLDFADFPWPISLSLSEEVSRVGRDEWSPVAHQVGQVWEHLFVSHFGMGSQSRSRMVFRKACSVVFARRDGTILEVSRFLSDRAIRAAWLGEVADRRLRYWWAEFAERSGAEQRELTDPILNKLDAWLDNPVLRRTLAQRSAGLDMRDLMDKGAVVLAHINESATALGPETAALLGTLLATKVWLAAMSRHDIPEDRRRPFFLVADEPFGYLGADAVFDMVAKARKYRLCPVFAVQSTEQVKRETGDHLLRVLLDNRPHLFIGATSEDTWRDLRAEIAPMTIEEAVHLPKYSFVARLHVGAASIPAFVLRGLPPLVPHAHPVLLTAEARHRYARPAREVEADILAREGMDDSYAKGGEFTRRTGWDKLA